MASADGFELMMKKLHEGASSKVDHVVVCPNPEAMLAVMEDPRNSYAQKNKLPIPCK